MLSETIFDVEDPNKPFIRNRETDLNKNIIKKPFYFRLAQNLKIYGLEEINFFFS